MRVRASVRLKIMSAIPEMVLYISAYFRILCAYLRKQDAGRSSGLETDLKTSTRCFEPGEMQQWRQGQVDGYSFLCH